MQEHHENIKHYATMLYVILSLFLVDACTESRKEETKKDFVEIEAHHSIMSTHAQISVTKPQIPTPEPKNPKSMTWVGCGITKKAFMSALASAWKTRTGVEVRLQGGGATRGIREVATGRADMGGTCRHKIASKEESNCELHPVGWDALAVAVHPDNPVGSIDLQKLRAIFTGKISNWQEVGGPNRRIELFVRQGTISGVGLMGRELLFANPTMPYASTAVLFKSSGPLEETLERSPFAIALTGISSAKKRKLKVLPLGSTLPTTADIVSGRYPLSRPLYLVTAKKPHKGVIAFLDFVQSTEGQKIIALEGTVPLRDGAQLWELYRSRVARTGGLAK